MSLEIFLGDVELPFTHIAFVLFVGVADVSTLGAYSDVRALDAKNLHAIGKEEPVIEHIEFPPLHLLDVAVESVVLPSGKQHRFSLGNRVFNASERGFISRGACGLLLHRRKFHFNSLTGVLIEKVME